MRARNGTAAATLTAMMLATVLTAPTPALAGESACLKSRDHWIEHGSGQAPPDPIWELLGPKGPRTAFFKSGKSYIQVLRSPLGPNPYYGLARAYTVATLNVFDGAAISPEVRASLDWTRVAFTRHRPRFTSKQRERHIRQNPRARVRTLDLRKLERVRKNMRNHASVLATLEGDGDCNSVEADTVAPTVTLKAKRSGFSPNGDGRHDGVTFRFNTNERGTLNAVVRGPGGRVFAVLVADKPVKAGKATLTWDGMRDWRRNDVPSPARRARDGKYAVELSLTDVAGNVATISRKAVVDTTPPRLSWHVLRPGKRGTGPLRLRFQTRERHGKVVVISRLVNQYGRPTVRLLKRVRRPGRTTLNLRVPANAVVPGAYRVELEVRDQLGNSRMRSKPLLVTGATKSQVVRRLPAAGRRVALTFDDCVGPAHGRRS